MKLHRLRVVDFAAIREADIEFGPGLNVLYGPNDLGKSSLAEAIRLAFLLPHTSTHIEEYVPWTGGRDPVVEMTFETEPQRIWRVRKEFRKSGSALLQESKDGVAFDDVERARKVDGKLREILRWGIPEPGGSGGAKGLPTSFLATVLLSTQSNVTAVLNDSLQSDPSGSGKDRIAAALQAVAQDPLFAALLRATQLRRDEAYTDSGKKKTAKGSVLKAAADRVNQARDEREGIQKAVDDSDSVEKQLRDLIAKRGQHEEAVSVTTQTLATIERLATQTANLAAATEHVRLAREEVLRIESIGIDVQVAERTVAGLGQKSEVAEQRLKDELVRQAEANAALGAAEVTARATGLDPAVTDTVARQSLELRKAAADQASREAQQRIDRATAAAKLVDAAAAAAGEHASREQQSADARAALADSLARERSADEALRRVEQLERALADRAADAQAALAQADVDKDAALRAQLDLEGAQRNELERRRAAIVVPPADALGRMRRLGNELDGARGALNVGLVVTLTPHRSINVRVTRDGTTEDSPLAGGAFDVEADAEVDIDIGDVATVRVKGGRREAQRIVESLDARWAHEVEPHLGAAKVASLDELTAKFTEVQQLDASIRAKDAELQSLRVQVASLVDSARVLREAFDRRAATRAALGDASPETIAADLGTLGANPAAALRLRREQSSRDRELARVAASQGGTANALAEERSRNSRLALDAAVATRDAAVAALPAGVTETLSAAQGVLATASNDHRAALADLASLESTLAAHNERIEAAVRQARVAVEQADARVAAAHIDRTKAITDRASQVGRLEELQRLRAAQDLATAEKRLSQASERLAALPVPERIVTEAENAAARNAKTTAATDLGLIEREIQRTHGALEQVGGAVARERLRDAIDAFESAERHERETEADYEAWLLLLEQMKEADAAQLSNLGQALAPAIAGRFEELTQRRYESVQLTAQLGTEGVVVAGAVRSTARLSVGTREQLSTLYRLSLAEYLATAVVLDDQLVQSDDTRMDWFRALLSEKARSFQIVVFTCRPIDYLGASAMVPKGRVVHRDSDAGFVRAIDLGRAVSR